MAQIARLFAIILHPLHEATILSFCIILTNPSPFWVISTGSRSWWWLNKFTESTCLEGFIRLSLKFNGYPTYPCTLIGILLTLVVLFQATAVARVVFIGALILTLRLAREKKTGEKKSQERRPERIHD